MEVGQSDRCTKMGAGGMTQQWKKYSKSLPKIFVSFEIEYTL